ncbi:MAG: DUF2244 domain-containing protein [Bradyrhizobiaceae bacterium]|nr:DUF2244 domain-containing protein [Bradyrhizobiaceae bacterium]
MAETTHFPAQSTEPTLYAATLRPHRSLSPAGFVAVMAVVAGVSFAAGIAFLLMGAWPIFGFFGLDVALVYFAFRASFRAARAYEDIHVTPSRLLVRQVSAHGEARENVSNPRWVRVETERDEDYGMTRLALISRGVPLVIGAFLGPRQREEVADGLTAALATAKR